MYSFCAFSCGICSWFCLQIEIELKSPQIAHQRPHLLIGKDRTPVGHTGAHPAAHDLAVHERWRGAEHIFRVAENCRRGDGVSVQRMSLVAQLLGEYAVAS